jgi:hypothetical protein
MDVFDNFFKKFAYKFPKGYPDLNNPHDKILLESILSELGINLYELKKPYEFLSSEAKKVADNIKQQLNLPDNEIMAHSKNRIIVFTDRSRQDIFNELESLGYERDATIKGSSGGGFKTENGIEIIHKNITGMGSSGLENEDIFIDQINGIASKENPITIKIIPSKGPTLTYSNIVGAKGVGKEGESKGWKADAHLIDSSNKIYPISIKKDGGFRWSSAMKTHGDILLKILEKAEKGEIPNLELKPDESNPRVLNMVNSENNKNYGRVYIKNAPGLDIKELAFGIDNADVVQRTFSLKDFTLEDDTLEITSTKNYKEESDFTPEDLPILQLERNASKATQLSGLTGRGITIRTVPISSISGGPRANTLIIDYNDL